MEVFSMAGDDDQAVGARRTDDRVIEGRGTGDGGTTYRREENVLGGIEELRPERNDRFHVLGFDIASAELTGSMKRDLELIIQHLKLVDDVNYRVVVTGTASESRIQRLDPEALAQRRADAIADHLIRGGISRDRVLAFSHGTHNAPSATSTPEVKANWRGAYIDIKYSGSSRRPAPKSVVPPLISNRGKDADNVKVLLPPTKLKDVPKKLKDVGEFISRLNESASSQVYFNYFVAGWSTQLAALIDENPALRQTQGIPRDPIDVTTLKRLVAHEGAKKTSEQLDAVKAAGRRLALDQIRALGPYEYERYARGLRARLPSIDERRRYYEQRARRGQWDL
jgi:outer membrane protein OmpA-like peptidoglycan-associated protein